MNDDDGDWENRRWPLTLWEIGLTYRGKMLAQGWTIRKYWKQIELMKLSDILLAVNPQGGMSGYQRDSESPLDQAIGMPERIGDSIPAPGTPIALD